jgi:hypothetical protein
MSKSLSKAPSENVVPKSIAMINLADAQAAVNDSIGGARYSSLAILPLSTFEQVAIRDQSVSKGKLLISPQAAFK